MSATFTIEDLLAGDVAIPFMTNTSAEGAVSFQGDVVISGEVTG